LVLYVLPQPMFANLPLSVMEPMTSVLFQVLLLLVIVLFLITEQIALMPDAIYSLIVILAEQMQVFVDGAVLLKLVYKPMFQVLLALTTISKPNPACVPLLAKMAVLAYVVHVLAKVHMLDLIAVQLLIVVEL